MLSDRLQYTSVQVGADESVWWPTVAQWDQIDQLAVAVVQAARYWPIAYWPIAG
jgi:hypothetical protein